MSEYRYILDIKSNKFNCIRCGEKRAVRFVDLETGSYLPDQYSRCDREVNCGYFHNPYNDGYAKALEEKEDLGRFLFPNTKRKETGNDKTPILKPALTIPKEVFTKSLKAYHQNNFCSFLSALFGDETASQLIAKYFIGTSSRWPGATVFWFISIDGGVRAGQIKAFDDSGHTLKLEQSDGSKKSCTTWIHSVLEWKHKNSNEELPHWLSSYIESGNKVSCIFGEHLLKREPYKPVAIVEAPKTAIIASVYMPQVVWLAVGSLSYLTEERCKALKGRNVVLYPDLNAFEKWQQKAHDLSHLVTFKVSDLLEKNALESDKAQGLDLADYLVRFDYKLFLQPLTLQPEQDPGLQKEFYHHSFEELIEHSGYDRAVEKVRQYQKLSERFSSCETFVVHRCKLLRTYQENQLQQAS